MTIDRARFGWSSRSRSFVWASLVSGVLSGYLIVPRFDEDAISGGATDGGYWWLHVRYGPGFFFGAAIAFVLWRFHETAWQRCVMWIGASTIAWRLAIEFALQYGVSTDESDKWIETFLVPGLIGGALLALAHGALVARTSLPWIVRLGVLGALLGFLMYLVTKPSDGAATARFILMFSIWQVGIALGLARWTAAHEPLPRTPPTNGSSG